MPLTPEQLKNCIEVARVPGGPNVVPDYNSLKTEFSDASAYPARPPAKGTIERIYEAVGHTPLLRLKNLEKHFGIEGVEVYAKLEHVNAGGSVKDRIARRMIELLEEKEQLREGDVVIEATSGNTGVGLAMVCAVKGYKLVVTMPQKMSMEKENCLRALGAEVIRTRNSANWNDADSHIAIAMRLRDTINAMSEKTGVRAFTPDQYSSRGNIDAHYCETGKEIFIQMQGKVDYLVISAGTGGTFTGCAKALKDELGDCVKCVAVDPVGSILHKAQDDIDLAKDIKPYEVEGIGYDFHPATWRRDLADAFETVDDAEAFATARLLISKEGVLCGGSAGSSVTAAFRIAKTAPKGSRIVTLIPDNIRNYVSKFVSDDWMLAHTVFKTPQEHSRFVQLRLQPSGHLPDRAFPSKQAPVVDLQTRVHEVIAAYPHASHVAVRNGTSGTLAALLSREALQDLVLSGHHHQPLSELVSNAVSLHFVPNRQTTQHIDELAILFRALSAELANPAVVLVDAQDQRDPAETLRAYKTRHLASNVSTDCISILTKEDFVKILLQ